MKLKINDVSYTVTDEVEKEQIDKLLLLLMTRYAELSPMVKMMLQGGVRALLVKHQSIVDSNPIPKGQDPVDYLASIVSSHSTEALHDVELTIRTSEQDHTITALSFPYDLSSQSQSG